MLPNRPSMERFADGIAAFYEKINRQAQNPLYRFVSALTPKDVLGNYYRRYFNSVQEALDAWQKEKRDMLFHGATAGIVIGAAPGASCGAEDALLAAQNMSLFAHAAGIGSCLIGFAVEAMKRAPQIQIALGMPKEERVHAVLALGRPAVAYPGVTGRRPPLVRWVDKPPVNS